MMFVPEQGIEEYIRGEFRVAFDEWEHAHGKEKEAAVERLNRATRTLYDFVGYDKLPPDFQFRRSTTRL